MKRGGRERRRESRRVTVRLRRRPRRKRESTTQTGLPQSRPSVSSTRPCGSTAATLQVVCLAWSRYSRGTRTPGCSSDCPRLSWRERARESLRPALERACAVLDGARNKARFPLLAPAADLGEIVGHRLMPLQTQQGRATITNILSVLFHKGVR